MIGTKRGLADFVLVLVVMSIGGCASTRMTSKVDPVVVERPFRKILVHASFNDLEAREVAEDKLCAEMQNVSVCECAKSVQLFFPGRQYSAEEAAEILLNAGIDGVLILQPTGSGTNSHYVPPTSRTTSSARVSGNSIFGSSTTTTSGGYSVSKPWETYEASLYFVDSGDVVWYATAKASGNRYADAHDLIRSASAKAVEKLLGDRAIPARRNANSVPSWNRR